MNTVRGLTFLAVSQTLIWASLYYVFPALLLRWEADFGWSRAELTGAITLAVLVSGAFAPVVGRMIDRGFGRELMTLSAVLGAAGMLCLTQVQTLWQFYLIWAINGLAMSGTLYDACFSVVTRSLGASAKRAITAITLVAGLAGTISFPLVALAADAYGWRFAVGMAALVIVCVGAPLSWFGISALPEPQEQTARNDAPPDRSFLRTRVFWFFALAFACAAILHGSTLHHLLPYLDERIVPAATAVTIAALIGPSQVVGRIILILSSQLVTTHTVAIVTFVLMGTSVVILMLGQGELISLYVFVVMFGSAYGTVSILRPVLAREILGARDFGSKHGSATGVYQITHALAPFLGALIWMVGGYQTMFTTTASLSALGVVLYIAAHRAKPSDTR